MILKFLSLRQYLEKNNILYYDQNYKEMITTFRAYNFKLTLKGNYNKACVLSSKQNRILLLHEALQQCVSTRCHRGLQKMQLAIETVSNISFDQYYSINQLF